MFVQIETNPFDRSAITNHRTPPMPPRSQINAPSRVSAEGPQGSVRVAAGGRTTSAAAGLSSNRRTVGGVGEILNHGSRRDVAPRKKLAVVIGSGQRTRAGSAQDVVWGVGGGRVRSVSTIA